MLELSCIVVLNLLFICVVSQPLWRPNVPGYFPWLELNGLFVSASQKTTLESSLNSACCAFLSHALGTSSSTTLFTWKQSPVSHYILL